ncbi:MAG: RHS repeat domain-containing protein [Pyrinomonadaceae bacterium]
MICVNRSAINSNGVGTTVFVYSSGKLIAEYSTQLSQTPTISYTTTDHLGSPRIITDTTGNVKSRRDFMPFGEDLFNGVGARSASLKYSATGDDIKQKFTGYLKDIETGLDFAEARMYENRHGRFTAVDPLFTSGKSSNPQTFNRYVYVGNSPVVVTDPTGMIGDYFSRSGTYLGNDGKINDGLIYFATETRRTDDSTYIDVNSIVKTTLEEVIKAQNQAVPLTPGVDNTIQEVAQEVTQGVIDGGTGIAKGVGNAPAVGLNGLTSCIFNCGVQGSYFQGSNPLAVPLPFSYNNAREASYGSASSFGTIAGFGTAAGTIFGGSSSLSVVPETTTTNTVTVGRWMSQAEFNAMQETGMVQHGAGGTTYVAFPANPNSYFGPARPGSVYAEFGVPRSSLQPAGRPDWAQIPGPNSLFGRNEIRFGRPAPQTPPATNPCITMCRTNVP